jgi:hypothetical protein
VRPVDGAEDQPVVHQPVVRYAAPDAGSLLAEDRQQAATPLCDAGSLKAAGPGVQQCLEIAGVASSWYEKKRTSGRRRWDRRTAT